MDILTALILFVLGVGVAIMGSITSGGGGLIMFPALIFLGLPPTQAVATGKFGAIGSAVSTIYSFGKAKKIVYKFIIPLLIVDIIAAAIGARLLVEVNEEALSKVIGFVILAALPLLFIKKELGLKQRKVAAWILGIGFLLYFPVVVYDGFLGPGAGLLLAYILVIFFGLSYIEANATLRIPWLATLITITLIFAYYGLINYAYGAVLIVGRFIGGFIGAHIAISKGENFVRLMFSLVVITASLKLLFF